MAPCAWRSRSSPWERKSCGGEQARLIHDGVRRVIGPLSSLQSTIFNSAMNIVITGASEGIGAALATQLGARGDRVVLAARRERELNEMAARLGPQALAVPTDVTRRAQVEQLRDRAIDALGHIDVWVNNAGRGVSKLVAELTDDEFDSAMRDNVKSAL